MSSTSIQVPPDSSGKKIATVQRTELYVSNTIGNIVVGSTITGVTSGATAVVTSAINQEDGNTELYLKEVTGTFINAEPIQTNGVTVATSDLSSGTPATLQFQKVTISDPNNPENVQRIDRFGATVNTFTDGAPTFSPFGAMAVGERQTIKSYNFPTDSMDRDFYDETVAGGTLSYDSNASTIILGTGTASGDRITRTSHFYHPYEPGNGQLIQMTVAVGDSGKTNVRRRWGYYDDSDGIFWELEGTQLSICVRSSSSGTVVDTKVLQDSFSNDRLDGSDSIGFNLNYDASNIYWMDLQHLGSGRVRFGINEPSGEQIVAHIQKHANILGVDFPYMKSASLPLRWEQENIGAAGSSSEMRVACATVKHSSKSLSSGLKHSQDSPQKTVTYAGGETPILGIRPSLLYKGISNRGVLKIISVSLLNGCVVGNSPVFIKVYSGTDTNLTGSNWTSHLLGASFTEYDSASTSLSSGHHVFSFSIGANASSYIQDTAPRDMHSIELYPYADGATQPMLYITAQPIIPGSENIVVAGINWEEIS